jgi:hypothetical protein
VTAFCLAGYTMCQAEGTGKPSHVDHADAVFFFEWPCRAWRDTTPTPKPPATDSLIGLVAAQLQAHIRAELHLAGKTGQPAMRVPEPFSRKMKRRCANSCKPHLHCVWPAGRRVGAITTIGLGMKASSPKSMSLGGMDMMYRSSRLSRKPLHHAVAVQNFQ